MGNLLYKIVTKPRTLMKILLTLVCFFIIIYHPKHPFEITFLDVGQGDGIYICDGDGTHFFIDGGSSDTKEVGGRRILPFLKSNGIRNIDYWFVTHADSDHISGLLEILEGRYKITYLILPKAMPKDESYEKLVALANKKNTEVLYMEAGNFIKTKTLQWKCVYPENIEMDDRNDASLVLELEKDSFRALFTGDISSEVEEVLVEQGVLQDVSLYKSAHHGSKYSNSMEFLQVIQPEIAIISCGEDNSYGHPHEETLERLESVDCEIYTTASRGKITIKIEGDRIGVVGWEE